MMESTSPMCCTCTDCVFRRWFQTDTDDINDYCDRFSQIFGSSGLSGLWDDVVVGLQPQTNFWTPPTPQPSPVLQEPLELLAGNERFIPRTSSPPPGTNSPSGSKPISETASVYSIKGSPCDFLNIPIKNPSKSAKWQKKKHSELLREAPAPSSRLHVSNVPFWYKDVDLLALFMQFGKPRQAEIIYNERGSKGFGFVTFANVEEATAIRQIFDKKEVHGRVLEVNYASKRSPQRNKARPKPNVQDGFVELPPTSGKNGCDINDNVNFEKQKTNRGRRRTKKPHEPAAEPSPLCDELSHAHQNRQTAQGPFSFRPVPSDHTQINFSVKNDANLYKPDHVAQFLLNRNFNVQNNVIAPRQFRREITPPTRHIVQRKVKADNPYGLTAHRKFPTPRKLQQDLLEQDMEFSKTYTVENSALIEDPPLLRNTNFPGPNPWLFNFNISLRALLEKLGP